MTKIPFQAESQRLLELMINSIYTHKEIFLRELISNASDAIDKMYYRALTDDNITFNREDYYIHIQPNKEERTLTITDTGIGMSREELENNLGTIAKSGSLAFKKEQEIQDGHDIIGQFGVGFYAAFMIASEVTVTSRSVDETQAYAWTSDGTEGFSINPVDKETIGTTIVLTLKENSEDESYDEYLEDIAYRRLLKSTPILSAIQLR